MTAHAYHRDLSDLAVMFDKGEVWSATRALIDCSALEHLTAITERPGLNAPVVYQVTPLRDPETFSTTEHALWEFIRGVAYDQPVDIRRLAHHFKNEDAGVRIMTVLMAMFMGGRA